MPSLFNLSYLVIHLKQLLYDVSVVAKARHLVLAAELAAALEPVVEQAATGRDDFQRLQSDVLETLGLVVGVDVLQRLVEQCGKGFQVGWRL